MRIFVAGHNGMVGNAICKVLDLSSNVEILKKNRSELDLLDQFAVKKFFEKEKPDLVILAAATVGGIFANETFPAKFIYQNLQIQNNIIHFANEVGISKLIFLGSSCIYPKFAKQPLEESSILSGKLEPTNEPYAIAKIAGIKMCESYNRQYGTNYKCLMPTNTFGPNDNYDALNSHFFPSLIRKIHALKNKKAKKLTLWGDGSPKRELIFVDDLADACIFLMDNYFESDIINVGTGEDITIKELAETIANVVEYKGKLKWDTTKPNGTMRKVMDVSKIKSMGWEPKVSLKEGLERTYEYFKNDRV